MFIAVQEKTFTGSCIQCCGSLTVYLFLAKSRSSGKAAFLFLKIRQGKNFRKKTKVFSS